MLISHPQDTVDVIGRTVTLKCSSNLSEPVWWTMTKPQSINDVVIYPGPDIVDNRIRVDKTDRYQNLIIQNISFDDAGQYKCIDDNGFGLDKGHWASAELTIIGLTSTNLNYI